MAAPSVPEPEATPATKGPPAPPSRHPARPPPPPATAASPPPTAQSVLHPSPRGHTRPRRPLGGPAFRPPPPAAGCSPSPYRPARWLKSRPGGSPFPGCPRRIRRYERVNGESSRRGVKLPRAALWLPEWSKGYWSHCPRQGCTSGGWWEARGHATPSPSAGTPPLSCGACGARDWCFRDLYFIAEQPAPAPHLAHPEGCAALSIVLVTGLRRKPSMLAGRGGLWW